MVTAAGTYKFFGGTVRRVLPYTTIPQINKFGTLPREPSFVRIKGRMMY
ncbi:MAG TPA: hypothetical protein VGN77_02760 [Steroidobacteraceae bacterium]|nr:hypothetical protein [Steroidobacteraceae bacterium]